MNIVHIAGRLGRDAETRFTSSGQKVTSLTVATSSRKGGQEETIWWRVSVWGDRYDKMIPYLKKGAAIIVVGEMQKPELYTNKDGQPAIGSLEIRADMIRFSPFGKSNEGQEFSQTAQGNGGGMNNSTNASAGFNPASFPQAEPAQEMASAASSAGFGQGEIQEDDLPF